MHRPTKAHIGNMDWEMRSFGYAASEHPTMEDVQRITAEMPGVHFPAVKMQEFLETAEYAYMLQLKHRQR